MSSISGSDSSDGLNCMDVSLTKQSFKKEADINNLVKRYSAETLAAMRDTTSKLFGDFTNVPDYQTALNMVNSANEKFAKLPAKVRDRFKNNPALLLDFISKPENKNEAIEIGLIEKPKVAVDVPVPNSGVVQSPQA